MKKRIFSVGESYRPVVSVIKVKKDIPTVLQISGRRYVLDNADTFKGEKRNRSRHT